MDGNCKGAIYRGNIEYVTKKHGNLGMKLIMDDLKKHGYKLDLDALKDGHWYPMDARMQFLRSTVELFQLDEEQLLLLGRSGFKKSIIAQFYLKLAGTPKKIFEMGPGIWAHNYDTGKLHSEYKGNSGSYFRITDFDAEDIFFKYLIGYYMAAFEQANAVNIQIEYQKTDWEGKPCHEYLVKWD